MPAIDVYTNDSFVEGRICALNDIVVGVLFITERVKRFEDELEESFQVLRIRRGDEDVRVIVGDGSADGHTESG